ncbi:MAG: peptidoglycan/xylan/chitin deacetylase (PgdA/CDA1 family) [Alteromonadaceae bacterium]
MKQNHVYSFLIHCCVVFLSVVLSGLLVVALPAQGAIILQYHHVSSNTPPITSVSVQTFTAHMNYLKTNQFKVIPLPQLLEKIINKQSIGDKVVVITFDDGYRDVYEHARPILKQLDWPYTVFINPQFINQRYANHMSWEQLRQITTERATIANHTMKHDYLVRVPSGLDKSQWHKSIVQDINQAQQIIDTQISQQPHPRYKMLAYPYGEYDTMIEQVLSDNDFFGFGQHSGAVGPLTPLTRIPRFPASGIYANLETLSVKLNALAMPITASINTNPVFSQNPPTLTLSVDTSDFLPANVQCFYAGSQRALIKWVTPQQFSVTANEPLPLQRSRYNCTAPSIAKPGRYYWFSQLWINQH